MQNRTVPLRVQSHAGVARPVSATRNMALDLSLVETACLALDVWRCSERIRAFKNA